MYFIHCALPCCLQMATLEKAEELLEQLRGASFDAAKRDLEVRVCACSITRRSSDQSPPRRRVPPPRRCNTGLACWP